MVVEDRPGKSVIDKGVYLLTVVGVLGNQGAFDLRDGIGGQIDDPECDERRRIVLRVIAQAEVIAQRTAVLDKEVREVQGEGRGNGRLRAVEGVGPPLVLESRRSPFVEGTVTAVSDLPSVSLIWFLLA